MSQNKNPRPKVTLIGDGMVQKPSTYRSSPERLINWFLGRLRSPSFALTMALLFIGMFLSCLAIDVAKGQLGDPIPTFNSLWIPVVMSFLCALLWPTEME